jgi:hypothetical protein
VQIDFSKYEYMVVARPNSTIRRRREKVVTAFLSVDEYVCTEYLFGCIFSQKIEARPRKNRGKRFPKNVLFCEVAFSRGTQEPHRIKLGRTSAENAQ